MVTHICFMYLTPNRKKDKLGPQYWLGLLYKVMKWGSPLDETAITEAPCLCRCDTIKIPSCLKAASVEQRPKICSPSSCSNGDVSVWMQYIKVTLNQLCNYVIEKERNAVFIIHLRDFNYKPKPEKVKVYFLIYLDQIPSLVQK